MGVEETALWTIGKIDAIRTLSTQTVEYVRERLPMVYSLELINAIFERPYCRIQNLVEAKIAGRQAASRYFKKLAEIGVLQEQTLGREKLFVHPKFLQLLIRDSNVFKDYR